MSEKFFRKTRNNVKDVEFEHNKENNLIFLTLKRHYFNNICNFKAGNIHIRRFFLF